jgi:aspartate/methionine/tyrosine aminotransferase
LAQNLFISAPNIAQHAALGAMSDTSALQRRVEHYRRNRALLLDRLPRMGLSRMAPPDGAFYLYVDIGRFGLGSVELCRRLLDDTGVALTPGVDFDPTRGERYVRLSFAGSEGDIAEAAARMETWLGALGPRGHREQRMAGARV